MLQNKILEFLRKKKDYVSGEDISASLKISRQALWKHIQELKDLGYEIIAVPHLGYRLENIPDKLFDFELGQQLNTNFIGRKIYYFESMPSTMEKAMQLGMEGAPEGTIILAESQTRGKGRLGRSWFSPKSKGIYLSLLLRPKMTPNKVAVITLLSAVSVCEAIKQVTGLEPQIKWPNDIMLANKKIGGILTELNAEMDKVNFVVIGIGLNVNNDKKNLISGATSIKEHKSQNTSRIFLLQEILRRIEINYISFQEKGQRSIIDKWREYSITLNRRVKVYCQKEHIEGEAVNIDIDGGLLIRKDSGLIQKVMTGDVIHCR